MVIHDKNIYIYIYIYKIEIVQRKREFSHMFVSVLARRLTALGQVIFTIDETLKDEASFAVRA